MGQEDKELKELRTTAEVLNELKKTFDAYLPQVREQVKEIRMKAVRKTTERPLLTLGFVFLAGVIFGAAISKNKD